MKHTTKPLLILALVATAALSIPGPSHARKGDAAHPSELRATTSADPTQDSVWGRAAAYACRYGFRYVGTPGFNAFSGFCIIALIDALIS